MYVCTYIRAEYPMALCFYPFKIVKYFLFFVLATGIMYLHICIYVCLCVWGGGGRGAAGYVYYSVHAGRYAVPFKTL